ncbi:hypothetical protein VOLCADRAFT_90449 [Volvox carteri f. nagariensis]|uniref:TPM domain-containing protein n=1 Tax=Volvox carteri f. nagariensis TaxID=3068 RepID=D8TUE5_VOLCA|nr:uncharacterized protein VOLCADRAFT_90449 [Volvox carteri f. nagariensis]EFJ48694.1 hypothetical protein VOLCADRAFT_90449 [Volvox carteri f. nagariensis]|eukprot:XP_002950026.1 hypothetical protein VOLCADRAFT_90449 [Volvox carteri f. nagariensis]
MTGLRCTVAAALSSLCMMAGGAAMPLVAWADPTLTRSTYVYDAGRLLGSEKRDRLDSELAEFSRRTGWNVRVVTSYGPGTRPDETEIRAAWGPLDKRSVIVEYDATAPSLINLPYIGDEAVVLLRRPWWFEFKGRFGNLFYVREQGEQTAILASTQVLMGCLARPGGCAVVPGLPEEQYYFTLVTSIGGGLVAGFVSKLEPQGFVQRRWVWLLIFSPLWASLFINFGLGPVVSRTDDKLPVIGNCLGFALGAASPYLVQRILAPPPLKDQQ